MINDKNLSYPGWKAIYPVDSAIQRLNNRGLSSLCMLSANINPGNDDMLEFRVSPCSFRKD